MEALQSATKAITTRSRAAPFALPSRLCPGPWAWWRPGWTHRTSRPLDQANIQRVLRERRHTHGASDRDWFTFVHQPRSDPLL